MTSTKIPIKPMRLNMLGSETLTESFKTVRSAGAAMDRPLSGRIALVTGSTSGIGLGVLEALAGAGATVAMNGLGERDKVEAELARVRDRHQIEAAYVPANLMDPTQCTAMIAEVEQRFGRIDILVNNAGIQHVAPIDEFPIEKWDAILAINLTAAFHGIRAALPHMKARKWGRIVNVASAHGLVGSPFKSAYVAAKHGILGLTKVVALEVVELGITCNAICPGYVRTPLVDKQIDDQAKSHCIPRESVIRDVLLAKQPTKKFVEAGEVAAATIFLCSPAANSITGIALPIEGGWTSQ
ncbi:MAG: 3-hydroxybutyrate dehydrogenase [Dongiaceae bacterium]